MKINDFFEQHQIDLKDKRLLVAASAGPDSMALLDMLVNLQKQLSFTVFAAHFDHQLRADSSYEVEVLQNYCAQKKICLFNGKWDKHDQPQTGIEAAAREARYHFLTNVAHSERMNYLLTAHHGDDLLENILLKFIRSGNPEEMNSLQDIGSMHGVVLLRPLLAYSKQELLEYDQEREIDYVIDSTNTEDETVRNRLRHHVVPLLKEENPNLISNALRFSEKMSQLTDLADEQLNSMRTVEPFLGAWRIKTDNLNDLSTEEKNIFWQKIIWQKYHRRVNENLGNFEVIDYQGYSYLVENKPQRIVQPFSIELNQQFEFNGAYYLLTTDRQDDLKEIGSFWLERDAHFTAGSLVPASKLLLKNGQRVKAKKKFAEKAIPFALRSCCITIYAENEPVFVEKCYQKQDFITDGKHYFLYIY